MYSQSDYLNPDDGFAITVLAAPHVPSALVCLGGEIDMTAKQALSDVADRLSALAPTSVIVDLADVTFAGSTLANFAARLHQGLPTRAELMLCRPTTDTRLVLQLTGMDQIATLSGELPDVADPDPHRRRRLR